MRKYLIFTVLFIALVLVSQTEAAKKKKKRSRISLPADVSEELYCNSCQAIIRESLKKIRDSRKEYDVVDALEAVCKSNLNVYEYPPPNMKKGCDAVMADHQDTIESMLRKRGNNEEIEDEICVKKTKACQGVDPKNTQTKPQTINVNGKEVPIGEDGSVKTAGINEDL